MGGPLEEHLLPTHLYSEKVGIITGLTCSRFKFIYHRYLEWLLVSELLHFRAEAVSSGRAVECGFPKTVKDSLGLLLMTKIELRFKTLLKNREYIATPLHPFSADLTGPA